MTKQSLERGLRQRHPVDSNHINKIHSQQWAETASCRVFRGSDCEQSSLRLGCIQPASRRHLERVWIMPRTRSFSAAWPSCTSDSFNPVLRISPWLESALERGRAGHARSLQACLDRWLAGFLSSTHVSFPRQKLQVCATVRANREQSARLRSQRALNSANVSS
jgi:hypothetical protein